MRRRCPPFLDGIFLLVTFLVELFFADEGLLFAFFADDFLVARFLLAGFFEDVRAFFVTVFLRPVLARAAFFVLGRFAVFFFAALVFFGRAFRVGVFLVDERRAEEAPPAFFAEVFLLDVRLTGVLLPLVFFLAAAFFLGIDLASKVDSENGRLYIRNCRAEGFSLGTVARVGQSDAGGEVQPGLRCSTTTVV